MTVAIDCGLGDGCANGIDYATIQIVKPPSRFHIPTEGDNLYDDQGKLIAKMVTYIFKCDHLFCDDCLTGHKAACDNWTFEETETPVDGVPVRIPAYTKTIPMTCPLCKADDATVPDKSPTAGSNKWSKKKIAKLVAVTALAILSVLAAILLVVILV